MDDACIVQDAFGRGRLTGIDMCDDADISDSVQRELTH